MEINLLAFGQAADIAGKTSWKVSDVGDTDGLRVKLAEQFPILPAIKYSMAVNKKVVPGNTELRNGDTVALLPPFSGG